jgi:DNA-binding transcriptional regulator YhcF (GntR family)
MLALHIDPKNGVSLCQQLVQQLKSAILTRRLQPGEQLPSVRELAKSVELNPLTVSKAYALLEQQKFVDTHWGKGSFVAETIPESRAQSHLDAMVAQFVDQALPLAGTPSELIAAVKKALKN